jgi:hypothetical protein
MALTGGASGIGLAITRHFASEGKQVAILDRDVDVAAEVVARLKSEFPAARVTFKQCDVSSWESQHTAFEEVHNEYGSIDIVMANAGITENGKLVDFDEETVSAPNLATLNVNLIGVIFCKWSSKAGVVRFCFLDRAGLNSIETRSNLHSGQISCILHEKEHSSRSFFHKGQHHLHSIKCRTLSISNCASLCGYKTCGCRSRKVFGTTVARAEYSNKCTGSRSYRYVVPSPSCGLELQRRIASSVAEISASYVQRQT